MTQPRVLISGAGVAGTALALVLVRRGWAVTVIERAPALREGGHAVDFRGPVHRRVLELMGLWGPIHERRTRPGPLVFVDRDGTPTVTMPAALMAGDVEILRGDLVRLLYERSRDHADYRFGDRITGLQDQGAAVDVTFERGPPATFDLLIGADGLHSGVRDLLFGGDPLRHHGHRIASFRLPDPAPLGARVYSEPGRAVGIFGSDLDARALLVCQGGPWTGEERHQDPVPALRSTFAGMGWETPRVLDALATASDLYVDSITTVHLDRYARGRVGLLGDAAWGGTLGGQGTSLAIVGAWMLSGELGRGEPAAALRAFERDVRGYASGCQSGATRAGAFFAPRTRPGLWLRDRFYGLLTTPRLLPVFEWMVQYAATDLVVPDYAA